MTKLLEKKYLKKANSEGKLTWDSKTLTPNDLK